MTIKIAVAEDFVPYRDTLVKLLNKEDDMEVIIEANNGFELLQQLESNFADVVLLDFRMPVMNGLETAKQLAKKHPVIRVIAISQ